MKNNDWHKFPTLFALYIAQSIPMSFFSTVVPIIMRQEHYSLASIGLVQLVKLPWILKFLWAPMIDNRATDRRSLKRWIISSELFYALVIMSIGWLHLTTNFTLIIALIIISFIASATQDIAVDKYAILSLKEDERSLGNSMQSAGSFVGSLFGTGVLLMAYHYLGWRSVVLLLALFVMVAMVPLIMRREPQEMADKSESKRKVSLRDILTFFQSKQRIPHLITLIFYYSGIIGIMTMLKPMLVDLGYSTESIAFMFGIFGGSVAALCALGSGFIIRLIGRHRAMHLFLTVSFVAAIYFWIIYAMGTPTILQLYVGVGLVWGAYGLSTVGVYTSSMDHVRHGREGTDFTIQIMITHLSSLIISTMSGRLTDIVGYQPLFIIEAILSVLTLLFIFYTQYKQKQPNETI